MFNNINVALPWVASKLKPIYNFGGFENKYVVCLWTVIFSRQHIHLDNETTGYFFQRSSTDYADALIIVTIFTNSNHSVRHLRRLDKTKLWSVVIVGNSYASRIISIFSRRLIYLLNCAQSCGHGRVHKRSSSFFFYENFPQHPILVGILDKSKISIFNRKL